MSEADAEKAIPAVVRMFSGCEDKQTSADGTYRKCVLVCVCSVLSTFVVIGVVRACVIKKAYRRLSLSLSLWMLGWLDLPAVSMYYCYC